MENIGDKLEGTLILAKETDRFVTLSVKFLSFLGFLKIGMK